MNIFFITVVSKSTLKTTYRYAVKMPAKCSILTVPLMNQDSSGIRKSVAAEMHLGTNHIFHFCIIYKGSVVYRGCIAV